MAANVYEHVRQVTISTTNVEKITVNASTPNFRHLRKIKDMDPLLTKFKMRVSHILFIRMTSQSPNVEDEIRFNSSRPYI
jgi:hypothetical protein